jgi:uncharacterized membrane-anchored protein YhcB (DUF1043 family)
VGDKMMLELQWITLGAIVLGAMIVGGLLGRFILREDGKDRSSLRRQLDELKQQHQSYQINVTEHFGRTTELIEQLNQQYGQIQDHLNHGAEQFIKPEYRLESARTGETRLEDLTPEVSNNDIQSTPRDYATKGPNEEGTLSETFGLKKSDLFPEENQNSK